MSKTVTRYFMMPGDLKPFFIMSTPSTVLLKGLTVLRRRSISSSHSSSSWLKSSWAYYSWNCFLRKFLTALLTLRLKAVGTICRDDDSVDVVIINQFEKLFVHCYGGTSTLVARALVHAVQTLNYSAHVTMHTFHTCDTPPLQKKEKKFTPYRGIILY